MVKALCPGRQDCGLARTFFPIEDMMIRGYLVEYLFLGTIKSLQRCIRPKHLGVPPGLRYLYDDIRMDSRSDGVNLFTGQRDVFSMGVHAGFEEKYEVNHIPILDLFDLLPADGMFTP